MAIETCSKERGCTGKAIWTNGQDAFAEACRGECGFGYEAFLAGKRHYDGGSGFDPDNLPAFLFDFQAVVVRWALQQGRAAIFADCGMGKTPQQLAWADAVARREGKPVLILTPLAVSAQTIAESRKFEIDAERCSDGQLGKAPVIVTNYERLHYFNPGDFAGVVCDESSILKSFDGTRRAQITDFMRRVPYRLLCTATAAPNDYTELGTSSEALGYLGHMDMLGRFFRNEQGNSATGRQHGKSAHWRFKGHAQEPFWRWCASWARALRKPSDLGFDDGAFVLPALQEREHLVAARSTGNGMLFELEALDMFAQREERRRTLNERCDRAAELVNGTGQPALLWVDLNDEGNVLAKLIPDAVQVSGSDTDEAKEDRLLGFAQGKYRVLITKKTIGAWGLNFQHCAQVVYFPSYSYEQYYQAVRRCWRYGQKRPVTVDVVTTLGAGAIMASLQRKAKAADEMFARLVAHMREALTIEQRSFDTKEAIPSWL